MVSASALIRKAITTVLFLGIAANAQEFPLFSPLEDGTGIGFGASSTSVYGCATEYADCEDNSMCSDCRTVAASTQNHGTYRSCDDLNDLICDWYGISANCIDNNQFVNLVECLHADEMDGCTINGICSGALGVSRSSGASLLVSTAVAGLLVAAMGMVL